MRIRSASPVCFPTEGTLTISRRRVAKSGYPRTASANLQSSTSLRICSRLMLASMARLIRLSVTCSRRALKRATSSSICFDEGEVLGEAFKACVRRDFVRPLQRVSTGGN